MSVSPALETVSVVERPARSADGSELAPYERRKEMVLVALALGVQHVCVRRSDSSSEELHN